MDEANETVRVANARGHKIDLDFDIAKAQARLARIDAAIVTARSIVDASSRRASLREIGTALAEAGRVQEALGLLDSAELSAVRDQALQHVARSLAKAGQIEEAMKILSSIKDGTWRDGALSDVATASAPSHQLPDEFSVGTTSAARARNAARAAVTNPRSDPAMWVRLFAKNRNRQ